MDYKSIIYALNIAETGSFVRAADKVGLTQSAISRSIIALEKELGILLFDRGINGTTLTPAGEVFIQHARNIVGEMQALKQHVAQYQTEVSGRVVIGTAPSLAVSHLPPLLAHCIGSFPQLKISVRSESWKANHELLRKGEIDFVIESHHAIVSDPDLHTMEICKFRGVGVFCRPGHPLVRKSAVKSHELKGYPFVTGGMDTALSKFYRQLLQFDDYTAMHVPLVSEHLLMLVQVVAACDAVLFTTPDAMSLLVQAEMLVELPVEYSVPLTRGRIVIVTAKGRTLSTGAQHLVDQFRHLYQDEA